MWNFPTCCRKVRVSCGLILCCLVSFVLLDTQRQNVESSNLLVGTNCNSHSGNPRGTPSKQIIKKKVRISCNRYAPNKEESRIPNYMGKRQSQWFIGSFFSCEDQSDSELTCCMSKHFRMSCKVALFSGAASEGGVCSFPLQMQLRVFVSACQYKEI